MKRLSTSPRAVTSYGVRRSSALPGWSRIEWPLLVLAISCLAIGSLLVWAMSLSDDLHMRDDVISWQGHVKKIALCGPALLCGLACRPRFLRANAYFFYAVSLVLLGLLPFIGMELNNARRWIQLPFVNFDLQPSELAKVTLILALARAFYRNRLRSFGDWITPILLALFPMGLVAIQPDLGTALTIVPLGLGMAYLAGASGRALLGFAGLALVVGGLGWKFSLLQDYQLRRIDTWAASFEPESLIQNRNGAGFHTYHARVAIGNGGTYGTGLGKGVANLAGHLPERESDSIFAVLAEEGGLVGTAAFLLLYSTMIVLLLGLAGGIRDRFARLVVGGVGLYFAAHFFINLGVNLGLLPMTGLTLPLLSTGGSSMLASLLALGLALGVCARPEPSLDGDAFR